MSGERGYDAPVISPDAAAQQLVAAIGARDEGGYRAAFQELVDAVRSGPADEIGPALVRLAPVLAEVPLGPASDLAQLAGSMAGMVTDTSAVLGVLVQRACQAMEQAAQFQALHRAALGGEPVPPDDASAIQDTIERFVPAVHGRVGEPYPLVEAWFAGSDWVQPMLYLSQRADVRATLPQRHRLLAAVESIREHFAVADWLYGLLLVLDNTPLIVLHRPTGCGYRVTTGGIGDNFQLHTLLAARRIGDPDAGWLPGTPPTPAMIAAADGTGQPEPPGGVIGQFNLVDPNGAWIWNEGRPADIPRFDGERVVILDPPPYQRSWNAGRADPLMKPRLRVDGQLTPDEAAARLAKARPGTHEAPASTAGYTDDLTIALPPGRSIAELVDVILTAALDNTPAEQIERLLVDQFGLSDDDADLARDRALGGLVRAATGNPANRPDPDKDPVAAKSHQRATTDPTPRDQHLPPSRHRPAAPTRLRGERRPPSRRPRWPGSHASDEVASVLDAGPDQRARSGTGHRGAHERGPGPTKAMGDHQPGQDGDGQQHPDHLRHGGPCRSAGVLTPVASSYSQAPLHRRLTSTTSR